MITYCIQEEDEMVSVFKKEIPEHNKTIYMLGPLVLADGSVVTIALSLLGKGNIIKMSSWDACKTKDTEAR